MQDRHALRRVQLYPRSGQYRRGLLLVAQVTTSRAMVAAASNSSAYSAVDWPRSSSCRLVSTRLMARTVCAWTRWVDWVNMVVPPVGMSCVGRNGREARGFRQGAARARRARGARWPIEQRSEQARNLPTRDDPGSGHESCQGSTAEKPKQDTTRLARRTRGVNGPRKSPPAAG